MEKMSITSSGNIGIGTGTTSHGLVYNSTTNIGMGDPNPSFKFIVNSNKMRYTRAALFNVVRDEKTNQIIDATLVKEFWVKVKSGVSFDVAAAHANGFAPDPDTEVIRELESIHF